MSTSSSPHLTTSHARRWKRDLRVLACSVMWERCGRGEVTPTCHMLWGRNYMTGPLFLGSYDPACQVVPGDPQPTCPGHPTCRTLPSWLHRPILCCRLKPRDDGETRKVSVPGRWKREFPGPWVPSSGHMSCGRSSCGPWPHGPPPEDLPGDLEISHDMWLALRPAVGG